MLQQPERAKEIIFLPWIISKILTGQVECTYRKTIKTGIYYTIPTRFARNGDPKREPRCLLEFYRNETVDPNQLTDREAQLAGCDDAAHIKNLFKQWYGEPLPTMWRNWFRLIQ